MDPHDQPKDAWLIAVDDQSEKKQPFIIWNCDVEIYESYLEYEKRCLELSAQNIDYYARVVRLNEKNPWLNTHS